MTDIMKDYDNIDGLVQHCSDSSVLAMELLQSCTKPSNYIDTEHIWFSVSRQVTQQGIRCRAIAITWSIFSQILIINTPKLIHESKVFHKFKLWIYVLLQSLQHCVYILLDHRPLVRYVKLRVVHTSGMFSPPPRVSDPDVHHGTCVTHVPWCMPGSQTHGFLLIRWRGKHSRRMRNPQFYVSGKRPMLSLHQTIKGDKGL